MKRALGMIGICLLLSAQPAWAGSITLGHQNYADGAYLWEPIGGPLVEEPSPFNDVCGNDFIASCVTGWAFDLSGPVALSRARLTLGLLDHDSRAPGQQVAFFAIGGVDLTSELNVLLEAHGGDQAQANVYTLDLPSSVFGSFLTGTVPLEFAFQSGLLDAGPAPYNSVALDFSTLDFEPAVVPEPATILLVGGGAVALAGRRLRRRR